jgi:hypothetical protein
MNRLLPLCIVVLVGLLSGSSFAAGEHKHETRTFATVAAGLTALDAAVTEAKTKAAAGNFEALHDISEDLHGIADGLKKRLPDVAAENRDRFKFNVDQVNALHEQLEAAHESKKADDVNRVVKRLEDVASRLKTLAPTK